VGAADAWEAAAALAGRCVGAADAWEAAAAGGGSTGGALRRGCRCVGSGGGHWTGPASGLPMRGKWRRQRGRRRYTVPCETGIEARENEEEFVRWRETILAQRL